MKRPAKRLADRIINNRQLVFVGFDHRAARADARRELIRMIERVYPPKRRPREK